MPTHKKQHSVEVIFPSNEIIEILKDKASHLPVTSGLVFKHTHIIPDNDEYNMALTYEMEAS